MKYLDAVNNHLKIYKIKVSTRLLGLEFKPNNIIKSKPLKFIVKQYCLIISNNGNLLCQL